MAVPTEASKVTLAFVAAFRCGDPRIECVASAVPDAFWRARGSRRAVSSLRALSMAVGVWLGIFMGITVSHNIWAVPAISFWCDREKQTWLFCTCRYREKSIAIKLSAELDRPTSMSTIVNVTAVVSIWRQFDLDYTLSLQPRSRQ